MIRKEPAWKQATDDIVAKVQKDGYGFMISHDELLKLLDLQEPETFDQGKDFSLKKLSQFEALRNELLTKYSIHLENERGVGYKVVEPDEQVTESFDKRMKKVKSQLKKANDIISHVQVEMLSLEAEHQRIRNLNKIAFLRAMSRKKKLPGDEPPLQLEM